MAMTNVFDYDRLREELDKHTNGGPGDNYEADYWLYEHKVAIAEELLNLRDRIEQAADLLKRAKAHKDSLGQYTQASAYMFAWRHVTDLIDGETK